MDSREWRVLGAVPPGLFLHGAGSNNEQRFRQFPSNWGDYLLLQAFYFQSILKVKRGLT
jgi:hypothetical protein